MLCYKSVSDCFFLLFLDIPHHDLLKCQIDQGHFYNIAFLEWQIQTALCSVVNFKLKVQIANDLLGKKNSSRKILLIWTYAQNTRWKNMNFQRSLVPFRTSLMVKSLLYSYFCVMLIVAVWVSFFGYVTLELETLPLVDDFPSLDRVASQKMVFCEIKVLCEET